jgi:hypothetical protein
MTMARNFTYVGATIVDEDAATDLAVLRLAQNPFAGQLPVLRFGAASPTVKTGGCPAAWASSRPPSITCFAVTTWAASSTKKPVPKGSSEAATPTCTTLGRIVSIASGSSSLAASRPRSQGVSTG